LRCAELSNKRGRLLNMNLIIYNVVTHSVPNKFLHKGKGTHGLHRCTCEDNISMDLRDTVRRCGLNASGSG